MRIVHVEDVFFPEAGYQINILAKYMALQGLEVYIITSEMENVPDYLAKFFGKENLEERDRNYEKATGAKIIRVPIYRYYSGRSIYKPGIFKLIDSLKPDILYVHGEDTYLGIRSLWRLNRFKYPVIFDDHMVEMASENRLAPLFRWGYRTFMAPIIKKHGVYVIRTEEDDYIFKHYGIPKELGPYVGKGSDLLLFHPDMAARTNKRKALLIPDNSFVFVYAGKMDEFKGGQLLAEALVEEFASKVPVVFLIVGSFAGFKAGYEEKVQKIFSKSKNNIIFMPTQPYLALPSIYQCADAALFPKQCSLSFYDAQACGLPVIAEANSINKLRLNQHNGFLFEPGNIDDFRRKIVEMLELAPEQRSMISENAIKLVQLNYDYRPMVEQYMFWIGESIKEFELRK